MDWIDGDKFSKHDTELMAYAILLMAPFALFQMFEIMGWALEVLAR